MAFPRGYLIALLGAVLAAPPPIRHLRFRAFAPGLEAPHGFVASPGQGIVPLRFRPTALSEEYEISGSETAKLVDAAGGEVGAVLFPPEGDYFTVILLWDGGRFRSEVFDSSEKNRPAGSITVLNLSGTRPTGRIRSEIVELGPGINGPYAVGTAFHYSQANRAS